MPLIFNRAQRVIHGRLDAQQRATALYHRAINAKGPRVFILTHAARRPVVSAGVFGPGRGVTSSLHGTWDTGYNLL